MEIFEILQVDLQPKIFLQVQLNVAPGHCEGIDIGVVQLVGPENLIIRQS